MKRMRLAVAMFVISIALAACGQAVVPCSAYACHPAYHNFK